MYENQRALALIRDSRGLNAMSQKNRAAILKEHQ